MGFRAQGTVVAVEFGQYTDKQTGEIVQVFDAFIAADDPKYAADRYSGMAADAPKVGDFVDVPVRIVTGVTNGRGWQIIRQIAERRASGLKAS